MRSSAVVTAVVNQHAEDAAVLYSIRTSLTSAPHVRLKDILRFDDRIAAHLDGLFVAGEHAWPFLNEALAPPTPGSIFAATIMAIDMKSTEHLSRMYALAEAVTACRRGLISAFGWLEKEQLRGTVSELLKSPNPFLRFIGVSACAIHRVDPGHAKDAAIGSTSTLLRARALRAAGELGRRELIPTCLSMLDAEDPDVRFWAAWSAVLLGNRGKARTALAAVADEPGPFRARAFRLLLQVMDPVDAQDYLRPLAQDPANLRWLIQGSGVAGNPLYVPWLIGHMADKKTARLAGEAFSLITGLDLAYLDLDRKPPEGGSGAGPNDDPEDPNVDMDEDDGLPWPDPERITRWWEANGGRFSEGTRYFMGASVTREHCLHVLKEGFQRQRILAAHYLCLLEPGTTLFEWRAPAFRQQRLLAAMA